MPAVVHYPCETAVECINSVVTVTPMDASSHTLPRGDCFDAAVRFISEPGVMEWHDTYRLVHGNVATLRQDEAINHAWVEEEDELVHEVANGRHLRFSKHVYYERFGITNTREYTIFEVLGLCVQHGHSGPWD